METYLDLNVRVEESVLVEFTHDMIFWPVGGSIQHLFVKGVNADSDEHALQLARDYAATCYDLILDCIADEQRAVARASQRLRRDLGL